MKKVVFLAWIVPIFGAPHVVSRSQADEKPAGIRLSALEEKSELAKLHAILASVDMLPPKTGRWVEVQTGSAKGKARVQGWVLRESETEIKLLTASGDIAEFDKQGQSPRKPVPRSDRSQAWDVRAADFAAYCRDFLAEKKKEPEADFDEFGPYRLQQERFDAQTAVVDFARLACWASAAGREEIASQLLNRSALRLREFRSTYEHSSPAEGGLHQFVAGKTFPRDDAPELAGEKHRRDSRHRSLAWNRLLARIPYRTDHDEIVRDIKLFESLVAEDNAWKEPSKQELAAMDAKQKAAYWLYHLRDLHVRQMSQPGMCRVLTESGRFNFSHNFAEEGTPNPAEELKKLGYETLPQIIAHLDDERPTRCVGYWRDFAPDSYYTLTYGDCCQQIFEAVALHSIYERETTNGYPVRDGSAKQCKERAERWWQAFQRKGEKQMLIEAVMRGDRDSYSNAERLIQNYPEAAFEPLRAGIRNAEKDWICSNLLHQARELNDNRVLALLEEQSKGPHLLVRVSAIEGLLERGRNDAVDLIIAEWSKLNVENIDRFESFRPESLLGALLRCGHERAIAALVARWKEIPSDWRRQSLERLKEASTDMAKRPFTPAVNTAIEKLLVSCLRDHEEDQSLRRTCDLAADALAARLGEPQKFDQSAPMSVRDRRIVEIENRWRQRHGLNPLPIPERRKDSAVAEADLAPLLKTLLQTTSAEAEQDASRAVERLGLGALPGVTRELNALPEAHPARERLSNLARGLAGILIDVHFSHNSLSRPESMLTLAAPLKNQPLTAQRFVEFLGEIQKLVPPEAGGLVAALDRDGDDTGIQLEIRVLPRRDPAAGGVVHLRLHQIVAVDGHTIRNSSFAMAPVDREAPFKWNSEDWKGLAADVAKALESPPENQFQVRVEITRGR